MFYTCSYFVILSRIALATIVLLVSFNYSAYQNSTRGKTTLIVFLAIEIVATYGKIIMGFF